MQFDEIPGMNDVKEALIASAQHSHVAHAQLFLGREGNAQLPLALAYAAYINCKQRTADGRCDEQDPIFRKYRKLIHPDLHFVYPVATTKKITAKPVSEMFVAEWRSFLLESPYRALNDWAECFGAENKQPQISREESRQVVRNLALKAFEAEYKTVLIWLPELMHPTAANALLKILEEPPEKTLFLLVSNNAEAILPTILSRTQLVHVRPFQDAEIREYLVQTYQLAEERAAQVAYMAEGNLREALRMAGEGHEEDHGDLFRDWMRACFKSDYVQMLNFAEQFGGMGKEAQKALMRYSLNVVRDAMLWRFSGEALVRLEGERLAFVKNFSQVVNEANLEQFVHHFNEAYFYLERNANAKITFVGLSTRIAKVIKAR